MPHAWVNGNPEIEPWRSIDVAEKAFAFSGVELTVFLSGSEIWSPATVNGTETRCHQREMRVLMRWGNAARIESGKEVRPRGIAKLAHTCIPTLRRVRKATRQNCRVSNLWTREESTFTSSAYPRKLHTVFWEAAQHAFLGIQWGKDCWHPSIVEVGGGGQSADSPHRERSTGGGPDTCSNWTPPRRLLKERFQAQMPGKQSTQRDFAHARHTLAAFSGR